MEQYSVAIVARLFFVGLVVIAIWGERDMKYWRKLALGLAFFYFYGCFGNWKVEKLL